MRSPWAAGNRIVANRQFPEKPASAGAPVSLRAGAPIGFQNRGARLLILWRLEIACCY